MLIRYLLLFAFLMVSSVGAASEVQLYLETGRVKVKNQGKVRFLSHSDPLNPLIVELELGEQVLTGKNTRARIKMRGKEEEIRLRVDTLFKVNSLDSDQTEVEMPTGKARFKIKRKLNRKKKQRRKFNVRTVTALIGVRGTEFVMGTSGASTSLLTLDGSVEMAAVAAPEIKVEVSIGEASKLDVGKAPTPPITVPPALQNSIVESDSADTFGEVSFPPAQDLEEAVAEQKEKEEAQKEEEQEEEEQEEEEQEEEEQEEEEQEEEEQEEEEQEEQQEEQTEESSADEESPEESDEVTSSETNSEETTVTPETESELEQPEIETIEEPELEELDFINDILDDASDAIDSIEETERMIQINIKRADKL
jgi:hypothetical protein